MPNAKMENLLCEGLSLTLSVSQQTSPMRVAQGQGKATEQSIASKCQGLDPIFPSDKRRVISVGSRPIRPPLEQD